MISLPVKQGSQEWLRAKAGIVSASNFDRVIQPKKLLPSASMDKYVNELLAEQMLGRPLDDATSAFMERGNLLEMEARKWYSFERDVDVESVGFLMRDDGRVGCSPDGLVGKDGGLEIKCPNAANHVGYLLEGPGEKYTCQIQGSLWITGRAWWDFVSFNPELPPLLRRIERDEAFIAKLSEAVDVLLLKLDASKKYLESLGAFKVYHIDFGEAA